MRKEQSNVDMLADLLERLKEALTMDALNDQQLDTLDLLVGNLQAFIEGVEDAAEGN